MVEGLDFSFTDQDYSMSEATERAFRTHYEVELEPSGLIEDTIRDIERVYDVYPEAVVAFSGGKDSLSTLCLAEESNAVHKALHWDYGTVLMPRRVERGIVDLALEHVPRRRLFVGCSVGRPEIKRFVEADEFRDNLRNQSMGDYAPLKNYAVALREFDRLQLIGFRRGESGSRRRKIGDGLFCESLGQRVAVPLRDWTARDVWSYLVYNCVGYHGYYDRMAGLRGGGPEAYEGVRMSTMFDDVGDIGSVSMDGVVLWRERFIPDSDG